MDKQKAKNLMLRLEKLRKGQAIRCICGSAGMWIAGLIIFNSLIYYGRYDAMLDVTRDLSESEKED